MTHGSLFSGVGGFDLAAEWVGWENLFHCEWNEFGQKVLKYYWPNAESFTDITKTNFSKYENKIDILTGGFPCQPYSTAGKRRGKDDKRHLWPEMLRAIREIRPRWIVGENVFGLINWSEGLVFHEVQTDLEAAGYEVQPFVLPAAAVNAPHRRDRIWFIAYCNSNGFYATKNRQGMGKGNDYNTAGQNKTIKLKRCSNQKSKIVTYSNSNGQHFSNCNDEKLTGQTRINALGNFKQSNGNGDASNTTSSRWWQTWRQREPRQFNEKSKTYNWSNFPSVSPICTRNDGLSNRLDGITFSKWRNETIKAAGNAICPQVALQIFNAINEYENLNLGTEETER